MDRGRFREYEVSVDLVHSLFEKPTAHSNPKDDHLRGECLVEKDDSSVRLSLCVITKVSRENLDSTQSMIQTSKKANISGPFWAAVTTKPIPRMERGAADSMSIAAILVYIIDSSGESTSRMRARICRRRKQIIEVTMTFEPTLSETHATMKRPGLPFRIFVPGMELSTTDMIESTAKKRKQEEIRQDVRRRLREAHQRRSGISGPE
jgi:hypothetical protein